MHEAAPSLGYPLLESGRVTDRETREEARNLCGEGEGRLLGHSAAKFAHLAIEGAFEAYTRPADAEQLADLTSEVFQCLPEGRPRLVIGGLSPEQSSQFFTGVKSRFKSEIGQKAERLGAGLRHQSPGVGAGEYRWTEQSQADVCHSNGPVRGVTTWRGKPQTARGFSRSIHDRQSDFTRISTSYPRRLSMSGRDSFRISLTPEQKEQVRKATGKEADTIELSVEELEERIAPMTRKRTF
jgi:hypothetical protein